MAIDQVYFPDDMYATREESTTAHPFSMPSLIKAHYKKNTPEIKPIFGPILSLQMPDADLPLITPKAPALLCTAASLVDQCKLYLGSGDVEKIRAAYRFADSAHLGQFRKSGEPYITHPIAVASILASWKLDAPTIQAGLMHDVLEDTGIEKNEMIEKFGIDVANLVDGVSKLDKLRFSSNEIAQAESFRKMLFAMTRDVRVIIVKLADRLHNLRTLGVMRPEKRARIANETMEIYVPIANHLGLNNVFRELQELSFANRYPWRYQVLYNKVLETRTNRRNILEKIVNETRAILPPLGIRSRIVGRDKTIYGIYNKMREKKLSFSEALDIYGFRIIVRSVDDCYRAMGAIHQHYKPVVGRFKDFIAMPKSNGYQSLHTTVVGPDGTPVEYQIRTEEMHRINETGILNHWTDGDELSCSDLFKKIETWLEGLLEIHKGSTSSAEFFENIKVNLLPDRVYVFTPQGKIINLPKGATPIDFAYQIHSDVGDHTVEVRINGETRQTSTELKTGDIVEIVTDSSANPNPLWLEFVQTGRARIHIRQFLRDCSEEDLIDLGGKALKDRSLDLGLDLSHVYPGLWAAMIHELGLKNKKALYGAVGAGAFESSAIIRRLLVLEKKREEYEEARQRHLDEEEEDSHIDEVIDVIVSSPYKVLGVISSLFPYKNVELHSIITTHTPENEALLRLTLRAKQKECLTDAINAISMLKGVKEVLPLT